MRPSLQQYWRLLVRYLRPQLGQTLLLLLILCVNILLQLINPLIMRRFLDSALAGGSMDFLTRLALLFIGIAAVQQVTAVSSTVLAENIGWRATNALRRDLARHCLNLDLTFHQQHTPGEMIERIDGDINALTRFFAQLVVQLFGNGLLLIGVMVVLVREDLRVGAAIGAFVVVTLLVLGRLRNLAVPHWQRSREASARFFGFVEERLGRHRGYPRKQCARIHALPFPSAPAHILADDDTGGAVGLLDDQHRLVSLFGRGRDRLCCGRVSLFQRRAHYRYGLPGLSLYEFDFAAD